jgi:hypothetical protein
MSITEMTTLRGSAKLGTVPQIIASGNKQRSPACGPAHLLPVRGGSRNLFLSQSAWTSRYASCSNQAAANYPWVFLHDYVFSHVYRCLNFFHMRIDAQTGGKSCLCSAYGSDARLQKKHAARAHKRTSLKDSSLRRRLTASGFPGLHQFKGSMEMNACTQSQ